ncbi:hypothetical protein [Paracoccus jiaweipingae]|uniref:hypothetical protein n=1 Tax=unclassified Paracoccus (in: a-proteobacteria) TaxID=2688777 RepID=UPI003795D64A
MRGWVLIGLLALAGCNENAGWNPNYTMANTPYGDYQRTREVALTGAAPAPAVMPRARPFKAPTAQDLTRKTPGKVVVATPVATVAVAPAASATARQRFAGLAQYAGAVQHQPGTRLYPRPQADPARAASACRGFATANAAQLAFLAQGGPDRDPGGMDPDGDGFVCGWDPRLYRGQPGL